MISFSRFFIVSACAALLAGCSQSSPSPTVAENALRQEIEGQSQGNIKLASFKKTDGQQFQLNGIPGYQMDYEAEIEFDQNGSWLSGGYGPFRLAYGFSTADAPAGTIAGFLNQAVDGGKPVKRGTRVKIIGSMTGAKKESGWKFESAKSQVSGVIAATEVEPVPPPIAAAAQIPPKDEAIARSECANNLLVINSAKQQWALEHRKLSTDTPLASDLIPYLGSRTATMPKCPSGGVYSLNAVGEEPTCSIPGHDMEAPRVVVHDDLTPDQLQHKIDCCETVRQISAAKKQWASEKHKGTCDIPTVADLLPYLPDHIMPKCPSGGVYSLNIVGGGVTCSTRGHSLDPMQDAGAIADLAESRRQADTPEKQADWCVNALRLIDAAKQQWAMEHYKVNSDTPHDVCDLLPYLPG